MLNRGNVYQSKFDHKKVMNYPNVPVNNFGTTPEAMPANLYSDISSLFILINNELSKAGSYRYETRKISYLSMCTRIINTASQLSMSYYVPVPVGHTITWVVDLGSLESDKLNAFSYQIQYYVANVDM